MLTRVAMTTWRNRSFPLNGPRTLPKWIQRTEIKRMQDVGDGLRVLIVDDHTDTATVHQMLLEAEGHHVVTAGSAEDALERVDELRPEVAILDLRLPGLSGAELLERLKERPDLASCRYICVSGSDERDVQWQQLGFDAFLRKPIAIDELRAMVRSDGQR